MPKLNELYEILLSLHKNKKGGRISVLQKTPGDRSSATTILISEGEIIDVKPQLNLDQYYSNQLQITKILLTPSTAMERHAVNSSAPEIRDVLRNMHSSMANSKKARISSKNKQTLELQKEVLDVLSAFAGKDALEQVNVVARRISPSTHPIQFLNECKGLIEVLLNPSVAAEIFEPIYDKVRKNK